MEDSKFDILYLEIEGCQVEAVRVFGESDLKRKVIELKKAYHLIDELYDFVFFTMAKSDLNGR